MGKALVINGLKVNNPVCLVTLGKNTPERVLARYFELNQTADSSSKDALTAFVGSLMEADIWDKMQYFYPILGSNQSDAILDVIDTDKTSMFSDMIAACSPTIVMSDNVMSIINSSTSVYDLTEDRGLVNAMSAIVVCDKNLSSLGLSYNLQLKCADGGYLTPRMLTKSSEEGIPTNTETTSQSSYTNRKLHFRYTDDKVRTIFKDKSVYATKEGIGSSTAKITQGRYFLNTNNEAKVRFVAIGKPLNDEEWNTFYDAMNVFLAATGK